MRDKHIYIPSEDKDVAFNYLRDTFTEFAKATDRHIHHIQNYIAKLGLYLHRKNISDTEPFHGGRTRPGNAHQVHWRDYDGDRIDGTISLEWEI